MAVLGIHHPTIVVPDLAKAVDFYQRVLGFIPVQKIALADNDAMRRLTQLEFPAANGVIMKSGWGYFKLLQFETPNPHHQYFWTPANKLGWRHFSVVTDNAQHLYERTRNDVLWHGEPVGHSVEGDDNVAYSSYGRDPFGNILELWQQGDADPLPFSPKYSVSESGCAIDKHANLDNSVLGLHHTALVLPNLDEGLSFYCETLGFEKAQYGPIEPSEYAERIVQLPAVEAIGWELKTPWSYLEVWEFKNPVDTESNASTYNEPGIASLCLIVDDCIAEVEKLRGVVSFNSEPVPLDGGWLAMGRDPFGNLLEFWQLGEHDPQPFGPAWL